jgi:hypothetical protein
MDEDMRVRASGIGLSQRAAKATAASLRPAFLVALVAVAAIFIRYGSLDPCDWAMYEFKDRTGLPFALALSLVPDAQPFDRAAVGRQRCLEGWFKIVSGEITMEPGSQPVAEQRPEPPRPAIDPEIQAKIDAAVARQKALILAEEREKSATTPIDPAMQAKIDRAEKKAKAALDGKAAP